MIITKKNVAEENTSLTEFGQLLLKRIEAKKISRSSLGKTVGVHRTTISDYILGKYLPKEETFHRIHQVFPDKELYDAYFRAVRTQEPRPNKNLFNTAEAYNFYKGQEEIVKQPVTETALESATLNDRYIMYSLKHTLEFMEKEGLSSLCPDDYRIYKELYNEYYTRCKLSY